MKSTFCHHLVTLMSVRPHFIFIKKIKQMFANGHLLLNLLFQTHMTHLFKWSLHKNHSTWRSLICIYSPMPQHIIFPEDYSANGFVSAQCLAAYAWLVSSAQSECFLIRRVFTLMLLINDRQSCMCFYLSDLGCINLPVRINSTIRLILQRDAYLTICAHTVQT